MRTVTYVKPGTASGARRYGSAAEAMYIAGGTEVLNLLKAGLVEVDLLIDVNDAVPHDLQWAADHLRIGAGARMADVAADPDVRTRLPLVADALLESASGQVRAMASVGGNLLQRTRCWYYRDSVSACNTRAPGSGCPALTGYNRWNAVVGGSENCIRVHPSDLATALTVYGAVVVTAGDSGERRVRVSELYRLPGDTPHIETSLLPGELIVAVDIPLTPFSHTRYTKVRDRASFEFALFSLAAGVRVHDDVVADARLVFGGVAPIPWRVTDAENALVGRPLTDETISAAAEIATDGVVRRAGNGFKVDVMRNVLTAVLGEWRVAR